MRFFQSEKGQDGVRGTERGGEEFSRVFGKLYETFFGFSKFSRLFHLGKRQYGVGETERGGEGFP